ncbi:monovalent cation/H(+) antiporter subunit G [Trujillonella humicola]|uniref:monovalent cation/H(+) antiporter subunit G n=1 Tax=Trujillonella humicola TaxID=3383699 RepID=UPI0039067C1C
MIDAAALVLLLAGAVCVLAASVGLLRFPDVAARLHALSTAENLGLGLLLAGLALRADSAASAAKLGLVWVVVLATSPTSAQLVAGAATDATATREPT